MAKRWGMGTGSEDGNWALEAGVNGGTLGENDLEAEMGNGRWRGMTGSEDGRWKMGTGSEVGTGSEDGNWRGNWAQEDGKWAQGGGMTWKRRWALGRWALGTGHGGETGRESRLIKTTKKKKKVPRSSGARGLESRMVLIYSRQHKRENREKLTQNRKLGKAGTGSFNNGRRR